MHQLCTTAGHPYYDDAAYALSRYVMRGYKGVMTPRQAAFSTAMSAVRIGVEWGFYFVTGLL